MTGRVHAAPADRSAARPVSHPHDSTERQADHVADVVTGGGSVAGWSFSTLPVAAPVHRDDSGPPTAKSDDDKKKEAAQKTGEALLETDAGKRLKQAVLDDPLVKKVKDAATSPAGLIAGGAVAAGGVAALAATGKALPVQPPAIPLDKITPGLAAQVTYEGPVNAPTFVGVSLTYNEQGPKDSGAKVSATDKQRAENARLAADQEKFRAGLTYAPGSKEAAEQKAQQEAIARIVASRYGGLPGVDRPLIPLTGTPPIRTLPTPTSTDDAAKKKEPEGPPIQRDVDPTATDAVEETDGPDDGDAWRDEDGTDPEGAVHASRRGGPATTPAGFTGDLSAAGSGRALPEPVRHRMERAFGASFADVRVHDGARSDALARSIGARAFTAGSDIHLSAGAPAPGSDAGTRLLAHELTHVRQHQEGRPGGVVRRSTALYMSTHGHRNYYRAAEEFHRARGWPAPVAVESVENLLENLVNLPRPIDRVRLVTHAVPAGVFLPLLRGGSASLFQQDLRVQSQGDLESELTTEHPTIQHGHGDAATYTVEAVPMHVAPQAWVARTYASVAADAAGRQWLRDHQFPDSVTAGGDLESLLWWVVDHEAVTAQREVTQRGRTRSVHAFDISERDRARLAPALRRNVDIYKQRAREHLVARGIGGREPQDQRQQQAAAAVDELETRARRAAGALIDQRMAAGGLDFTYKTPTDRYGTLQGALERGTFSNNVLFAKVAIPNAMPFEIRGCRIGQNVPWLDAFRDFFGMGAGDTRKRPDVSAPDLRHVIRGGRRPAEWLEGPRQRPIRGGTAEFDSHIIHSR